jgi:hypothetical protein
MATKRGKYERSTETRLKQSSAAKAAAARRERPLPVTERLARSLRGVAGRQRESI